MPLYVALGKATQEGKRHMDGLAGRHQAAVKRAEAAGGKVVASYALLGPHDYMVILECPDHLTAIKILAIAQLSARPSSLRSSSSCSFTRRRVCTRASSSSKRNGFLM